MQEETKKKVEILFSYISFELGMSSELKRFCEDVDLLRELSLFSYQNGLGVLFLSACAKKGQLEQLPDREEWIQKCNHQSFLTLHHFYDLILVLREIEAEGIMPIVFKGASLASIYPKPYERYSGDDDILVREEDMEKVQNVLDTLGYDLVLQETKERVWVYEKREIQHKIELHGSLWEDFEGSQIEKLQNMKLSHPDSLHHISFYQGELITLGITEHLIYQMFHIIKHFVVEGIGVKYLVDIAVYIFTYEKMIDWNRFWNCMDQLRYAEFCRVFFSVCTHYLFMPVVAMVSEEQEEILLVELLSYRKDENTWQIISMMSPFLEGRENISNKGNIISLLFPSPDALQEDFAYAKKCHILLPVAWIHKWFRFLCNRLIKRNQSASARYKIEHAGKRLQLMKKLGLIGGEHEVES